MLAWARHRSNASNTAGVPDLPEIVRPGLPSLMLVPQPRSGPLTPQSGCAAESSENGSRPKEPRD